MPKVKKIELSFVCDEDWNEMTPVNDGRHCASCQKTVVNFTAMTDAQIVAHYSQKKNEKTCGQFRNGQLDNLNKGLALPDRRIKPSFFRPILASALLSTAACSPDEHFRGEPNVVSEKQTVHVQQKNKNGNQVQSDTIASTSNEKFQPRKVTHVPRLERTDTIKKPIQPVHEVVIVGPEIDFPEQRYEHLGGVPAISYEQKELHKKGEVELTPPDQRTRWFKRLFRKNK